MLQQKDKQMIDYDFNSVIERRNTNSIKWDYMDKFFSVKDMLPMWVADMDFKSPQPVIDAVSTVASRGIFGYSGIPQSYCESVIGWMKRHHGWEIKQEWLAYSPGVVPALHVMVNAFTEPGDQVILQTPVYYPFFHAVTCGNREILDNPLRLEGGQYEMDLEDLESKIGPRTRMIIICNPHNPISRVWKADELRRLGEICIKNGILVVSDEIHQDIVYSGFKHVPFATLSEEFADSSLTCTAASKTFNLPGLQTSNIIIPNPGLRSRFTERARSYGVPSPNMFGVAATEAAYRYGEGWLAKLLEYLEGNISFLARFLSRNMPGVKLIEPQGTYLMWLDFRDCGVSTDRLANFIRDNAHVGLEPGKLFGCKEDGFERMNIACPRSILEEGLSRIAQAVRSQKAG
ncbi:MAG: MalY/PatB family protein [Dehalococcoidia bacterium]|jgi:cystathionine beta-lyase